MRLAGKEWPKATDESSGEGRSHIIGQYIGDAGAKQAA